MDLLQRIALTVVLSCCSESAIAQQTPSQQTAPAAHTESWWNSPWGEGDRLGNVNNLTPEGVKRATGLVKTGKVYALGIPTAPESAAYGTRQYMVERQPGPDADYTPNGSQRVTAFDEKISSSMGVGTQIDGFGHLGVDHHYYNGITGKEVATTRALQTADIPPIVTRGVLIDMTKHYRKPMLEVGDTYNRAEIEAAMRAQGVTVGKGDVVLFHTGWMAGKMVSDKDLYRSQEPGIGEDGAIFLADLGVVAIGSDTVALEALPSPPGKTFIVHQTLLAKKGVHVLETIDTNQLAEDGVKEFLFVLGIPRMVGTVQMVINPVAIS
ncbi:MAG TPA: cyclase family protein [Hyphomonadaceae bacterium]|nr:cyclase family protein [Hyphomonadaceae bacterium]HPN05957.1 cyclase family protein [Hyphomonadaceae bacterium]